MTQQAPQQPEQRRFLTAQEVSDRYHGAISVRTLSNWRNLGSGPPFTKVGGRILYRLSDIEKWEDARTVKSTSEYSGLC